MPQQETNVYTILTKNVQSWVEITDIEPLTLSGLSPFPVDPGFGALKTKIFCNRRLGLVAMSLLLIGEVGSLGVLPSCLPHTTSLPSLGAAWPGGVAGLSPVPWAGVRPTGRNLISDSFSLPGSVCVCVCVCVSN